VAKQQGEYLAQLFAQGTITGREATQQLAPGQKAFKYAHKGSLAYVGSDRAVMDVPTVSTPHGHRPPSCSPGLAPQLVPSPLPQRPAALSVGPPCRLEQHTHPRPALPPHCERAGAPSLARSAHACHSPPPIQSPSHPPHPPPPPLQLGPVFGAGVGFLWRSYETFAQISLRNQLLVANDWVRTKVFGRWVVAAVVACPENGRGAGMPSA